MNNLVNIQSQIEKLQKQASEIKAKEFHKTVLEIREKMQAFGITAKDLQTGKASRKSTVQVPAKKRASGGASTGAKKGLSAPVAAKYRGPEGQGWSGRGLTPRWMAALIAQGRTKEEFIIAA
jgi:DNA-binding protein H-NS